MNQFDNQENLADDHAKDFGELKSDMQDVAPIGKSTWVAIMVLVGLSLTTAAVAYTAPELLEPIANSLPDSLFAAPDLPSGESFGC